MRVQEATSVNRIDKGGGLTCADLALSVRAISCTRTGDDVMYIVPSCSSAMTSASMHAGMEPLRDPVFA